MKWPVLVEYFAWIISVIHQCKFPWVMRLGLKTSFKTEFMYVRYSKLGGFHGVIVTYRIPWTRLRLHFYWPPPPSHRLCSFILNLCICTCMYEHQYTYIGRYIYCCRTMLCTICKTVIFIGYISVIIHILGGYKLLISPHC